MHTSISKKKKIGIFFKLTTRGKEGALLPVQFVAIFCHIGYQNSSTYIYAFILFIKQGPS